MTKKIKLDNISEKITNSLATYCSDEILYKLYFVSDLTDSENIENTILYLLEHLWNCENFWENRV